jgi:hypothetical protein
MVMGEGASETGTAATGSGTGFAEAVNVLTLSPSNMGGWDTPSAGRLRYTGSETLNFHCGATISFITGSGNNQEIQAYMAKNGVKIAGSLIRSTGDSAEHHSSAIHIFTQMTTNDYISVYVQNMSSAAEVTVETLNMFATSVY